MKDPAFLLYSGDFYVGVADLTMEERGQYITLLCLQHQKGHLSERSIYVALCVSSLSNIPYVMAKFRQDGDGLYYQHRLEEEMTKRAAAAEAKRANGAKGGRPRLKPEFVSEPELKPISKPQSEPKPESQPLPEPSLAVSLAKTETKPKHNLSVNVSVNENIRENINGNENGNENESLTARGAHARDLFEEFWTAYPRKCSKGAAEKAWLAMRPGRELLQTMLQKLALAKDNPGWQKDGGQYIPYPATWLRARGWEDEIRPVVLSPPVARRLPEQMYNQRVYDPAKYAMPFSPEELEEIRRIA